MKKLDIWSLPPILVSNSIADKAHCKYLAKKQLSWNQNCYYVSHLTNKNKEFDPFNLTKFRLLTVRWVSLHNGSRNLDCCRPWLYYFIVSVKKFSMLHTGMPLCTLLLCWPPHLPACRPANLKSVSGFSNGIYLRGWDIIPSPRHQPPKPGEPDVAAMVYGHLTTKRSRHHIITLQ